jgi:hypothetical protein
MSNRSDGRSAPQAWHKDQALLVLELLAHNREIAAVMADAARRFGGGRGEVAREVARLLVTSLRALRPLPSQPHDTAIDTDGVIISKRSAEAMRFYGRTSEMVKQRWARASASR